MQSTWNYSTWLVGMHNGTATWEHIWQFPLKLNRHSPYAPAIPPLGIFPSEVKTVFTQKPVCEW